MDKRTAGLVGAISALTPLTAAAAPPAKTLAEVLAPQSYAELLQPIPNASSLLKEAMVASDAQPEPRIERAQYYGDPYYYQNPYNYPNYYQPRRRYYHHHHHHHHHNNYGGWGWGPQPYYHHHHHHHHHHDYYWR
jgi:hypothetical protein